MSVFLGRETESKKQFYVPMKAFETHFHVPGGTGKGKSTVLMTMMAQLFRHREQACHFVLALMPGQCRDILKWVSSPYCPPHVRERFIYWNPAEENSVLTFNPLLYRTDADGYFRVIRTCDCIMRGWDNQNLDEMPRLARWLQNAMWGAAQLGLTVSDCSHLLLPGSRYHKPMLDALPPLLRAEFAEIESARGEASKMLEAPRNRLKPFVEMPTLRNMFGSTTSRLNIDQMRHGGKIVLCNLSPQNILSPQASKAIGGLVINEILATARSGNFAPTYLWCDEFQNFVGPDMEFAIPEVRQLGIRLILSHQSRSQLRQGNNDLSAIMWQLQNRLLFAVQSDDADIFAHEFASILYDPKKIKDEMYSRRQLLREQRIIHLSSWSESESEAKNWSENYGTNWNANSSKSQNSGWNDSNSNSIARKPTAPLSEQTQSIGNAAGTSGGAGTADSEGTGGNQGSGKGGSSTTTASRSHAESILPVYDDFMEITKRTFMTFEEQSHEWGREIRNLRTGQALVRLVDDRNIHRVDIERYQPGYLSMDDDRLRRRMPQAIERMERFLEQNAQSEYFVSPQSIERETELRLESILNPVIRISTNPSNIVREKIIEQQRKPTNPMQ